MTRIGTEVSGPVSLTSLRTGDVVVSDTDRDRTSRRGEDGR